MLVSFLIPTRNRIDWLRRTLDSIIHTCSDRSDIEILLRIDDDDKERVALVPELETLYGIRAVIGPRSTGYCNLSNFIDELVYVATGDWAWFLDDDAWIDGNTWQQQLSKLSPTATGPAVNTEVYKLGGSRYNCGPKGLAPGIIIPMLMAKSFTPSNPIDICWHSYATQQGAQFVTLKGITHCHDGRPR